MNNRKNAKNGPDFLCIGAQKAGTSWLHEAIYWQPGVFLPTIKEVHYFTELNAPWKNPGERLPWCEAFRLKIVGTIRDQLALKESISPIEQRALDECHHIERGPIDDDWYRGIFEFASRGDCCGEVCPSYMSLHSAQIEHVLSINPDIRIVLLIRDPVDRMWSQIRMNVMNGKLAFDLDDFLVRDWDYSTHLTYTNYAQAIPRWLDAVGEDRLLPIVYDRIRSEPELVHQELLAFIGARPTPPVKKLQLRVNTGERRDLPPALRERFIGLLEDQYAFLMEIMPEQVTRWKEHHHRKLNIEV